jgi:2-polyprenyl-3-methyl-5-hydroxy-6-metoxy-1,4-benzoquinol methylase
MFDILVNQNDPFHEDYNLWRINRVKKMESVLGRDWFRGKKILELACGAANIGAYFQSLGAHVTVADARQDYLDLAKKKYNLKTLYINQEEPWVLSEKYDLIIHFGVLYHLDNWCQDLRSAVSNTDMMFLESAVANTNDPNFEHKLKEDRSDGQNSYSGVATVVSADNIEKQLKELNCQFQRYDDIDLDMPNRRLYQYSWLVTGKISGYETSLTFEDRPLYGGRRLWLVKKLNANDQ